jgi:hypothetical protein
MRDIRKSGVWLVFACVQQKHQRALFFGWWWVVGGLALGMQALARIHSLTSTPRAADSVPLNQDLSKASIHLLPSGIDHGRDARFEGFGRGRPGVEDALQFRGDFEFYCVF